MITYYKKSARDKNLVELETFAAGCWVQIEDPTEDEVEYIADKLNLEYGHLTDALDPNEVPRFEEEDGVPYIFTRTPFKLKGSYSTVPILFILGSNFIVSISPRKTELFTSFINQKVTVSTTQKIQLFIQMMKAVSSRFNKELTNINREVNVVINSNETISNKDILNLVMQEQTVNDFLNALVRTNTIINNLLLGKTIHLHEEDRDLVEDLSLANGQLIEWATSTLSTIKNLRDAYSTILTNNLNRVVKLFTSLTVVLTIPTMIASFFGMNVPLPFSQQPWAFGLIASIAFGSSALLIFVLAKKDWL